MNKVNLNANSFENEGNFENAGNTVHISLGMDVGTTNSVVTYCDSKFTSTVINIPNSKDGILPSCVRYLTRDEVEVGVSAYERRDQPSVVYSMKRWMEEGSNHKHRVIAENGEEFDVDPIEVTSHVIRAMFKGAEKVLGAGLVGKVTITVPARFSETAKYNTQQAAILAGLKEEDIYLINEPTAASLSYGAVQTKDFDTVLVYDLGGGTFDITLLQIVKGDKGPEYNVLTTGGDPKLGGDDVDRILRDIIINKIKTKVEEICDPDGVCDIFVDNLHLSRQEEERLLLVAERHKCMGINSSYTISLEAESFDEEITYELRKRGKTFPLSVSVPLLESDIVEAVRVVYEKTKKSIASLMSRQFGDPSKILLVGGSTKSPYLQVMMKRDFRNKSIKSYTDPDKSVGRGASIYTVMRNEGQESRLNDIIQIPIGIRVTDMLNRNKDYVKVLIPQDLHLPVSGTEQGYTLFDNQESVILEIYQGTSRFIEECVKIGDLEINELPPAPAGAVSFKVKLEVSLSGLLNATVIVQSKDGNKTYEKEIRRLSSNSTAGKNLGVSADRSSAVFQRNRRINMLKAKIQDPEMLELAIADLDALSVDGEPSPKVIKAFFKDLSKYTKGAAEAKEESRGGSGSGRFGVTSRFGN